MVPPPQETATSGKQAGTDTIDMKVGGSVGVRKRDIKKVIKDQAQIIA